MEAQKIENKYKSQNLSRSLLHLDLFWILASIWSYKSKKKCKLICAEDFRRRSKFFFEGSNSKIYHFNTQNQVESCEKNNSSTLLQHQHATTILTTSACSGNS